jgi:hypothetical protein
MIVDGFVNERNSHPTIYTILPLTEAGMSMIAMKKHSMEKYHCVFNRYKKTSSLFGKAAKRMQKRNLLRKSGIIQLKFFNKKKLQQKAVAKKEEIVKIKGTSSN